MKVDIEKLPILEKTSVEHKPYILLNEVEIAKRRQKCHKIGHIDNIAIEIC